MTLTDAVTKQRRDYWLGEFDTPASRETYHRLIAEWESTGRRLPRPPTVGNDPHGTISISEVILAYSSWVRENYAAPSRATIWMALRLLRRLFGSTSAVEFGPNRLRLVREQMIEGDARAVPPRKPWARSTVNKAVHQIVAMFKWAASHEMLPAETYQRLKTLAALRRGRTTAREPEPVAPVPMEVVDAVRPHLNRQVRALVDLQLLTGARSGELFKLRPLDIQIDDKAGVWIITLAEHKTAHHGHRRTIYLGPRAQQAVRPFLVGRALDAFLFSPAEAEQERRAALSAARKTPASCGNAPGTNRVDEPRKQPGDHYTSASYRKAIASACDRAFPPPPPLTLDIDERGKRESAKAFRRRLSPEMRVELSTWRREHRWHPHQLRHTTATLIRREFGLEAARIALGHSSALVTDAVYAERDMDRVIDVMKRIG